MLVKYLIKLQKLFQEKFENVFNGRRFLRKIKAIYTLFNNKYLDREGIIKNYKKVLLCIINKSIYINVKTINSI